MTKFRVFHHTLDVNKFIVWMLLTKVIEENKKALILVPSKTFADALDDYLWKFSKFSFLPHCLAEHKNAKLTPVIIASEKTDERYIETRDVVIVVGDMVPNFVTSFVDSAIVIRGDYEENEFLQERIKRLKDKGHECIIHSLKDSDLWDK